MTTLYHEIATAAWLVERIRAVFPDADEELLATAIEGETSLTECVVHVLRSAEDDRTLSAALHIRITELEERKDRLDRSIERKREIAVAAMERFGIKRVTAPDFTATLTPSPVKVIITAPELLPEGYWRHKPVPPPETDKALIRGVLQDGGQVPGATLSNQCSHVHVRRG